MLDLIFVILMIIIFVKANRGEVDEVMCNTALVIGVLAGVLGLVQAFFIKGSDILWILNMAVMLIAFMLKRAAQHFAKLYNQKKLDLETEYRIAQERYRRFNSTPGEDYNYNDPDNRFSGGDGGAYNGK